MGGSGSVTARPAEGARGQERDVQRLGGTVFPLGTSLPVSPGSGPLHRPARQASSAREEVGGRGRKGLLPHVSCRT